MGLFEKNPIKGPIAMGLFAKSPIPSGFFGGGIISPIWSNSFIFIKILILVALTLRSCK
jgi:hypothetical protein